MSNENEIDTISYVLDFIEEDILGAELKFALFSAALMSYRKDTCLRPFPDFLSGSETDEKQIERLESIVDLIPTLIELKNKKDILSDECWKFLYWLFRKDRIFNAVTCTKQKLKDLETETGQSSFSLSPDFIFEIDYQTKSSEKFDEQVKQYGVKYGYHGSRMDNFHSIVSNGLQVHMMKNGLYGEGIYLSEDLAVTMPYVSGGTIWKHSKLGHQVSCVAVCEILDHPGVKCQIETPDKSKAKNKLYAKNSEMGEVPYKYFVVTSSDLVRIKYILVFIDKESHSRKRSNNQWLIFKYPVATILFSYVIFLCIMAIWKSRSAQLYLKRYFKSDEDD